MPCKLNPSCPLFQMMKGDGTEWNIEMEVCARIHPAMSLFIHLRINISKQACISLKAHPSAITVDHASAHSSTATFARATPSRHNTHVFR
jgi:hypothetical protein